LAEALSVLLAGAALPAAVLSTACVPAVAGEALAVSSLVSAVAAFGPSVDLVADATATSVACAVAVEVAVEVALKLL